MTPPATTGAWTIAASLVITLFCAASSLVQVAQGASPILLIATAWFGYLTVQVWQRKLPALRATAVTFVLLGLGVWCAPLNPFALSEGPFILMDDTGRMTYFVGWIAWSLYVLIVGWRLDAHRVALEQRAERNATGHDAS